MCNRNSYEYSNIAEAKNPTAKFTFMKTLIATLLLLFTWSENERGLLVNEDFIKLVIDQHTTELELKEYKKRLKSEYKINVEYKLTLSSSKKIKSIELNVDCNDGFKGNMKTIFMDANQKAGFIRNYNDKADEPFLIGAL